MPYEFTHQYEREPGDLYIDEPFCSECLFERVLFSGVIHDPTCGTGTIIRSALKAGYLATSADITFRGFDYSTKQDFLNDNRIYDNIVTNPPYQNHLPEQFIHHALKHTRHKVAVLTRLAFLAGQTRYKTIFKIKPPSLVLVLSKRSSMPPLGIPVGGGKTDYCWIIWDIRNSIELDTVIDWIGVKKGRVKL